MTHHVVSLKAYYLVFGALLLLTITTVAVASWDLGELLDLGAWVNTVVAVLIAVLKATLVALYFMHVRYSSHLTKVFVVAGFFWLAILIGLIMSDFLTRERPSRPTSLGASATATLSR